MSNPGSLALFLLVLGLMTSQLVESRGVLPGKPGLRMRLPPPRLSTTQSPPAWIPGIQPRFIRTQNQTTSLFGKTDGCVYTMFGEFCCMLIHHHRKRTQNVIWNAGNSVFPFGSLGYLVTLKDLGKRKDVYC